jgi:hypothetical protein
MKNVSCLMNYEKYENLAITIQNMFTLNLRLVNRYYTFRKSQTYMQNVNYNYFISQNKETQITPLICFLSQKMKTMKMKGVCVPYDFQKCIKFCQNILLLSEYAKKPKYMSYFNRDKGPTDKVHNKREH